MVIKVCLPHFGEDKARKEYAAPPPLHLDLKEARTYFAWRISLVEASSILFASNMATFLLETLPRT